MVSNITKFPKELLALIFKHLTKANDRRRAAQTCKLFYDIVRHQSTLKRDNMLRMTGSDSDKSPIRVFENSKFFPFSKLSIKDLHRNIILESAFWSLHGPKISKIFFDDQTARMELVLSTLREYFPDLKMLTIECIFSESPGAENPKNILLPIENLHIGIRYMPLNQILALIRCSPLLKNLQITWINVKYLPQILPWLNSIEMSRVTCVEMPLEKMIILPSKVVIGELTINGNETPKSIREFIKNRTIDNLILYVKTNNVEFNGNGEESVVYFTRDHVLALDAAKSIKKIDLPCGVLEFEGSLDLLARLPGVEGITLKFIDDLSSPLYPFYWSTPEIPRKIRAIDCIGVLNLHYLAGLTSVTLISFCDLWSYRFSSVEIQTLIRNCPNLMNLTLVEIIATDADLIGHEDHLPISSLEKLESLRIETAPNITTEAFKSAFKFPNLKYFQMWSYNSSDEEPFNQHVAKQFTQNCPNLEHLIIHDCPINEEGFEFLIRHLPYLRYIHIRTKDLYHSLSEDKVKEMQLEFPYVKIYLESAISKYY